VDGQKVATLRGERIVDEFKTIVLDYVQKNYSRDAVAS
jgi:(E)-4-hydroxy-3-methylbut-2-enyl-diphosphate synthase